MVRSKSTRRLVAKRTKKQVMLIKVKHVSLNDTAFMKPEHRDMKHALPTADISCSLLLLSRVGISAHAEKCVVEDLVVGDEAPVGGVAQVIGHGV